MASYPSVKTDRVYYEQHDAYADRNLKLTLLDGSILEIWGDVYYNGVLLGSGGSGAPPIASQAEAEAGVDNAKMITSLRAKQAISYQALARIIATTAPLAGGGDLTADRTITISDFTSSSRGTVPNPTASSGRFLMDDGTWGVPSGSISGASGVYPFTYNTSTTEPPTGNQIRGNNATFASSTKLWIMETTTDGLDVTVGLGRIKAGFQIYVQNYNSSAQYAIWNVTADSVDKGAYWELTVTPASSAGTIPGGKVALQSLSSAQASILFSSTSTAPGLAPGSNNLGALAYLNGVGSWTNPNILAINAQTGTTYTLVLTDNGKLLTHSNAAAITVTVPLNSSEAFPVGAQITLAQIGAGKVTISPTGGVTVNATPSLGFRAQYSSAALIKTATDTWLLVGDLA